MVNRRPRGLDKRKICIICEGNEEYKYIERLKELHVWNDVYDVTPVNAEGNGNIPARYQDKYQNDSYDLVLVFCDTEKKPHEQYEDIKRKINEFHGVDNAADEVVFFGNPCTLQIVSKHWTDEIIMKPLKSANAPLVEKYTGIKGYKGKINQIEKMMESITADNYREMRKRIEKLSLDEKEFGSTNINRLMKFFEEGTTDWITEINNVIQ